MAENSEENIWTERRQFPRVEISTTVKFIPLLPVVEEGITKDISQAGMCLMTKRKLEVGALLQLKFDLPGDNPEHIEAVGRAAWVKEKGDGFFLVGIKFLI